MDDLSLRVYLENAADADRGGWLELPVAPERLDAFMRGVVGVAEGDGYAVVDHEPGWFGDVLGSDLESFSVSSLNLAARCVAHARDLAVADSVDGDVFLDMLATAAESEDVRFPSGIATLAARAGDVAEFWTEYSLPDSWRAGRATGRIGALRSTSASWMMASTPDRTCSAWMCSPRWRTRCGASVRRVPAWAISTRSRAR